MLFSLERNRSMFKKVFPTAFFEQFIDIGHYVQDLTSYRPLVEEYCKIIVSAACTTRAPSGTQCTTLAGLLFGRRPEHRLGIGESEARSDWKSR